MAENVLNRQFQPEQGNRAWVGDITYVRTASGWLYLAVVLDLFSRKVVGWAMAPQIQASLVCDALRMTIGARQPQPGLSCTPIGAANRPAKHTLNCWAPMAWSKA